MSESVIARLEYEHTTRADHLSFVVSYFSGFTLTPQLHALVPTQDTGAYMASKLSAICRLIIDCANKKRDEIIMRIVTEGLQSAFPKHTFTVAIADKPTRKGFDWLGGELTITCTTRPSLPAF